MTLEEKAKEYAEEHKVYVGDYDYCTYDSLVNAHIDGAESRQAEIDKACELLKQLLDDMKSYSVNEVYFYTDMREAEKFLKEQNK